jgi:hypothetical protein
MQIQIQLYQIQLQLQVHRLLNEFRVSNIWLVRIYLPMCCAALREKCSNFCYDWQEVLKFVHAESKFLRQQTMEHWSAIDHINSAVYSTHFKYTTAPECLHIAWQTQRQFSRRGLYMSLSQSLMLATCRDGPVSPALTVSMHLHGQITPEGISEPKMNFWFCLRSLSLWNRDHLTMPIPRYILLHCT